MYNISVCDDYSLPIDFVKKRPSSFDPCLVQHIPTNWASPSPQSDHQHHLTQPFPLVHPCDQSNYAFTPDGEDSATLAGFL
uniref:Uncharacterized protein n=1 Tax=Anopheles dirus TaxID=7168 RepID=A0A182NC77_9DIPT